MMGLNLRKILSLLLVIPLTLLTFVPSSYALGNPNIVEYVDGIPNYWPPGVAVDDILETKGNINELIVAFWTESVPIGGSAAEWIRGENGAFGNTEVAVQRFHDAGITVLIGAGGANEAPVTDNPEDGRRYGEAVGQFALDYNFDGVDFDIENFAVGRPDTTSEWLAEATRAVKAVYPEAIVTHAPQAPYFQKTENPNASYGYLELNEKAGDLIDSYNIQFYNQGNTAYDTYEQLFLNSGLDAPETSVKQIHENGVPLEKIIIGKPISEDDVFNTGYIPPETIAEFISQGISDGLEPGGVMGWQWKSDYDMQQQGEEAWSEVVSSPWGLNSLAAKSVSIPKGYDKYIVKPAETVICPRNKRATWDLTGGAGTKGGFDLSLDHGAHLKATVVDSTSLPDFVFEGDWEHYLEFTNTGNTDWDLDCLSAS
ncbi:glycosyl hydrolase family 18 protein [Okeania sp. SIO2B3]|uniref:glycosyl hydrolase family 18 protein n=1 Tax=Okeania sp. SIO2B3 TaxID=2607784 RepID=UPI0013C2741B|nr:glycosyl hydrolase family 18 protein [Okeania sp. SIO2B3]NET46850.1 hypothetical protein [Okeania sp. SIO2B3]